MKSEKRIVNTFIKYNITILCINNTLAGNPSALSTSAQSSWQNPLLPSSGAVASHRLPIQPDGPDDGSATIPHHDIAEADERSGNQEGNGANQQPDQYA